MPEPDVPLDAYPEPHHDEDYPTSRPSLATPPELSARPRHGGTPHRLHRPAGHPTSH